MAILIAAAGIGGARAGETRVAIDGTRWLVNGAPTHRGTATEGLLMNARMVNATFEDRTRPDFDAAANTEEFLAHIRTYAAHGIDAFTLNLQGGMPGYEGAVNSAFRADGSLRDAYLGRVARVIRACDDAGVVVILGLFYQRQSAVLADGVAVRAGVRNAVDWIADSGFTNVLVEIANEYPHPGFVHGVITSPDGQAALIRLARETAPGLLVTASGLGDGRIDPAVAEACDFLAPHWNGTPVADIPRRVADLGKFGKPIVCNEDDRTCADAVAALRATVAAGAGYGLMHKERNQTFPFRFGGAADDREFYAALAELTGNPQTGDGANFPPPESRGGGRWGDRQVIPRWFVEETAAPTHSVTTPELRWKLNPQVFSHGWELPARHHPASGRNGRGLPADARAKPGSGGQMLAFVPSLDLVIARQTGGSGDWQYEEFLRRACAAVILR